MRQVRLKHISGLSLCSITPALHLAQYFIRYFKKLPTILDATITHTVRQAGVLAVVTIVGPDPERNGKIVTKT